MYLWAVLCDASSHFEVTGKAMSKEHYTIEHHVNPNAKQTSPQSVVNMPGVFVVKSLTLIETRASIALEMIFSLVRMP